MIDVPFFQFCSRRPLLPETVKATYRCQKQNIPPPKDSVAPDWPLAGSERLKKSGRADDAQIERHQLTPGRLQNVTPTDKTGRMAARVALDQLYARTERELKFPSNQRAVTLFASLATALPKSWRDLTAAPAG
ncbi:hypothetical protein [Caballeronia choica]|uniref:hypothetical protein n=1 Tax=Caballeronia choica TaxID=326476 RepID=UPI000F736A5B|nr:hypothetical protein [Caballeronia choica]